METTTEASGSEVTRTDINDLLPEQNGILSTARHRITGGPAGTLRDDTLVTHGGMQITLRDAAKLGLVTRDESGKYSDVKQGDEQQPAATEKEATESAEAVPFADAQEALTAQLAAAIPPAVQDEVLHQIINGGIEGLTSGGEHREGIVAVTAAFQQQAFESFTKAGVNPEEFSAWARTNCRGELNAAMMEHASTRNPAVYGPLLTPPPSRIAGHRNWHRIGHHEARQGHHSPQGCTAKRH